MERDTVLVHFYDYETGKLISYYTTYNFSETLKAFHYMKYNEDISIYNSEKDIEGHVEDVYVEAGSKEMLTCIKVYIKVY